MKRIAFMFIFLAVCLLSVQAESALIQTAFRIDSKITGLNYANRAWGAYTPEEPVIVQFANNGSDPITSIDLYYQINDSQEIVETYTPVSPILSGANAEYSFKQKVNLGLFGSSIRIKAGLRMTNDEDMTNNEMQVTIRNTATGVPYTPDFVYEEDGVIMVDPIDWSTFKKNGNVEWDITGEEWSLDHSASTSNADSYLVSVGVWMTAGKFYDLKFDAYTDGDISSEAQKNKMSVYISTDSKATSDMNLIWENNAIDNSNAKYTFARYQPTKNGMYYYVFNCKSPQTASLLRLQNIYVREVFEKDAGMIAITSPADLQYQYTSQEKVSVLIHNFGSAPLPANQVIVNLKIDQKAVISETLTTTIDPNKSIAYTFKTPVDLSDVSIVHKLSAWATLSADQDLSNDTTYHQLESIVAGVPYASNFGTVRNLGKETELWSVEDKNKDEFMFAPASDLELDSFVFGYGGWRTGPNIITVPKSDDELFSRPIKLEGGIQYKLSYLTRIENEESRIPLTVRIYKVENNQRTLVKELWSGDITSTSYQEKYHKVDIKDSGIYEFGFYVNFAEPLSFRIRLGRFQVTQVYDVNLTLEEILIPATSISCYNTYPVGVIVRNSGKSTIGSFTLKANSSATGEVEKKVTNVSLAPEDTYTVYFDKDLVFNGTESEYLKITALAEGDGYEADNQDSISISYCAPSDVPSTVMLGFFRPDGWTSINMNRDEYGFTFIQGQGFVYNTKGIETQANDLLISNCYNLKKDKVYALEFNFGVNKGDTTNFDTYLLKGQERIDIVKVTGIAGANGVKKTFKGYISVPEDGAYPICMQLTDQSRSLLFNAKFNLTEVSSKPDIQLLDLVFPAKDTIFSRNETIKVTFKNAGKQSLTYIPFTCKVGDRIYYSNYLNAISVNDNIYTVEFTNVDLYTPGDYEVEISANVSQDATPENNILKKTIRSLPILDVAVTALDSPESGVLTAEESVTISVKNEGKGVLTDIPVKCAVTMEGSDNTVELTGIIAGPITDGETVQYQFTQTVNLYEEGRYFFNITAELTGDIKEENNQKEASVISSHKELDGGVVAIISPIDKVQGEAETVSIQVKNYSSVDLYEVPVSVEITYQEQGGSTPQDVSGKITMIKAGETTDYTFNQQVNMKALGKYSVKARTNIKNDANPDNDICEKVVKAFRTDVGVTEIISPDSGEELGLCEVKIRVKNHGESTVEQIPVAYKAGTIPQLGIITETILPGESYVYTFPVKYDFSAYKTYVITAYTELKDDADPSNNTCTKEIVNKPTGISSTIQDQVTLYPNPNNGKFTISCGEVKLQSVMIYNMEGVPVLSYKNLDASDYSFDTTLPNGNYLIKAITSSGVLNLKLIVRK